MSPDDRRVTPGTWGGEHLAFTVTESGAHAEFDCASGDITQPLTTDAEGRLTVEGTYVREHGGPARDDEQTVRKRARYSARIDGKTLTLDITLVDSNEHVGPFTLTHGAEPVVHKCL